MCVCVCGIHTDFTNPMTPKVLAGEQGGRREKGAAAAVQILEEEFLFSVISILPSSCFVSA